MDADAGAAKGRAEMNVQVFFFGMVIVEAVVIVFMSIVIREHSGAIQNLEAKNKALMDALK